jgi:hypothetical protein
MRLSEKDYVTKNQETLLCALIVAMTGWLKCPSQAALRCWHCFRYILEEMTNEATV